MKWNELKNQSTEDLKYQLEDTRRKLFVTKNEREATKKLSNPHFLKMYRKEIARILTLLTQRETASKQSEVMP